MKHLTHKNILIGSLQPWNSPLVSKHYIAMELTKVHNNITFAHTRRMRKMIFPSRDSNRFTFHNMSPDRLTLARLYLSPRFTHGKVVQSLSAQMVRTVLGRAYYPDIIISFDPVFHLLNVTYPNALKIYYCADHLATNTVVADAEVRLLSACDIVIAASRRLCEDLSVRHGYVNYLPHGVDLLSEYRDDILEARIDNVFAPFRNRVVLGFLGNIGESVDFELINYVARRKPDCVIVLVGLQAASISERVKSLARNVVCPGPVPSIGIKYCLKHFDVGIVPYVRSKYISRSNPIKIMQYVAAGIPVVSTNVEEVCSGNGFVYHCNNYEEFSETVRIAHETNSAELIRERIQYGKNHSWERRIEELDRMIGSFISRETPSVVSNACR